MGYYVFKITMFISRKSILTKMTMTTLTTTSQREKVRGLCEQRGCAYFDTPSLTLVQHYHVVYLPGVARGFAFLVKDEVVWIVKTLGLGT